MPPSFDDVRNRIAELRDHRTPGSPAARQPGSPAARRHGRSATRPLGSTRRAQNRAGIMTGMDPWVAAFERMSARHWRATEEARLGGWLLRAAGGFTGRANSALPLGDPGMPAERAVAEVEAWYSRRGLPPMVVIATGLRTSTSSLDQLL